MKFNNNILLHYMSLAPLALAFERTLECHIYKQQQIDHPILDIGCGEGLFAKVLFSEKIDTGIDPSLSELEHARYLGGYNELIHCLGDSIPKPSESYKTIFSNSVLEHIPDITPVLQEAYRLLMPGGQIFLTVPSDSFYHYTVISQLLTALRLTQMAEKFRRFYNKFWKHYHDYSLEKWCDLVTQAGFIVMEAYTYNPQRICILNDFLVPFSIPAFIIKRITNQWVLFPNLRKIILYPIFLFAERILAGGEKADQGGLVFLALTKE
jgi:2-polyprenyl-3-methyl-5-hydroxy-6-metoxy-1,4-benzoquinol methylase